MDPRRRINMTWCIEDQLEIVQELLELAKHDTEAKLTAAQIITLRTASERLAKTILVAIGSLRCTDLRKPIDDIENLTVRILRKAVRKLAKNLRTVDIDSIAQKLGLDPGQREQAMHIIEVASSRAKAGVQKALSDVYERLENNMANLRRSIHSTDLCTLTGEPSKLEDFFNTISRIIEHGLLTQTEIDNIVMKTANVLMSELNHAVSKISREFGISANRVRKALIRPREVSSNVRNGIARAVRMLNLYAATALLYELLSVIESAFLASLSPSYRVLHVHTNTIRQHIVRARSIIERCLNELKALTASR